MHRLTCLLVLAALLPGALGAQEAMRTERLEGVREHLPGTYALTNARIVTAPGQVLDRATLIVRNGIIEAVGTDLSIPPDAHVRDQGGKTLYAGFIDAHGDVGLGEVRVDVDRGPSYWNPQVRSFVSAADELQDDAGRAAGLRAQGFTVAHVVPPLGIFRGATALVTLGDVPARDRILRSEVAQSVSLARDVDVAPSYPNSPMGAIALVRQTLLDADWYARAHAAYASDPQGLRRPEANAALAALGPPVRGELPLLFETRREEEFLRVLAIAREFPALDVWVRGSGEEYRILDVLEGSGVRLVVPLAFPDRPEVGTPEQALDLTLAQLRHWHLAPDNPARLAAAGVAFAFSSDGLSDPDDFLSNLAEAVARGLDPDVALAALTTVPAGLLGIDRTHGTLEAGKAANIVAVEGDLFAEGARVREVWIDGRRYEISAPPPLDPRGEWLIATSGGDERLSGTLVLEGTPERLQGTFSANGSEVRLTSATIRGEAGRLRVAFPGEALGIPGIVRLSGSVAGDDVFGWSELPEGFGPGWRAERLTGPPALPLAESPDTSVDGDGDATTPPAPAPARVELADLRPAMEYGRAAPPEASEHVLVRGATIWTMGPQGRLEGADLLVSGGRVAEVGVGLSAPAGARIIDGTGKHLTPGLIDAHLHSGTDGVNESGSNIVPEVRMGDVVTHNNIWMYRQLAGGLTTAHVKHGSANPIGGQNVFMKMRWGALPDGLLLEGAPRTVKFALGENPIQNQTRYPNTRMGVQEIIRDNFNAAIDYRRGWEAWETGGRRGIPPRRDLRMEALVEILEGEILVSAHGYRQDEFLALVRLAEEFGFRIQTLQHGVEAYKIAPELAEAGVAAVVWSDWSSFKIEAYDATTYNARILLEAGVLTSLHSDDSQLASRMNWEAGKMLRTGIGEEDALALVTINPARILAIDDRVGSLEPGKDADFVIWSGHPLSQFTRAEQTWVDGRRYFDLAEDLELRREVERERAQLLQLVLGNDATGRDTP